MSSLDIRRILVQSSLNQINDIINITEIGNYSSIPSKLLHSLMGLLSDSFKSTDFAVNLPTLIYVVVVDENIISTVCISSSKRILPLKYHSIINSYYIYNVCTDSQYRGQGIMKHLLSIIFDDANGRLPIILNTDLKTYITYQSPIYYLEVDPNNQPAYHLYTSLGFSKVSPSNISNKFDLMKYVSQEPKEKKRGERK